MLSLANEVLYEILSHVPSRDALRLTTTCRRLSPIAMERALSEVTLSDPRRALQFCTYMVSDPPKRAYWLCCLRITSRAFDVDEEALIWKQGVFSWAGRLADLLEEAQNLRLLTISCMDALLWEEPRIGEAISALPNLTHLELYETGRLALDLVGTMCCRPNKLVLSLLQSRRRTTPVLSRILHLNSIRCLTLSHLKEIDNFLQNGTDGPLQLSNVRDLSIEGSSVPLSAFVRVFPNIHHIRVLDTSCLGLHSLGSLWPRLRHLCGHPHHLKDWPKNSPVHCLELDTTLCQHRQQDISDALLALEHLSPIVLSVELLVSVDDIGFCASLIQAAPRLRYLRLRLNIGIDLANITAWVDIVSPALTESSLTCISICALNPYSTCSRCSQSPHFRHRDHVTHPIDYSYIEMVPTRLAQSIPSLRCVALARGYQCWSTELPGRQTKATYSWFHVSGSGEQRSAELIKSWEGERVHDYMCRAEFDSIESGLDELFPSG